MKVLFSIYLLGFFQTVFCFSQSLGSIGYFVDSLPQEGVVLNKGWKFYSGDDMDFANPDYDDSNWEPIDPTSLLRQLPPNSVSGIGWIRLRIFPNDGLLKEPLALSIFQNVASEMFLNGKLVYSFGTISKNPEDVIAYNPGTNSIEWGKPFALPFEYNLEKSLVIAIRFAVQPNINYEIGGDFYSLIKIRLNTVNGAFEQVRKNERRIPLNNTFRIGVFFILAILHLAFFIYNSNQKAYLFFFLYSIFVIPADLIQFNLPSEVKGSFSTTLLYYILWQISSIFLLTALYILLRQKRGWIYWILVIATIIGFFIGSWVYSTVVISNLVSLEMVRTSLKALQLKTKGAWILAAGAISYLIFQGAFVVGVYFQLGYWSIPVGEIHILADILYVISALSIPLATTIYIALDFAFTSHALQIKLVEVEELSKLTIDQEKEKRELLSTINQTLEKQVSERTIELQHSLDNLKSTQAQLIQSEKMASLGELTAGIAHEIQNPLNFVNNFSEISNELISELKVESLKVESERDKGLEDELLNDIAQNLTKINHHGKRASDIVKGMLEHSRTSTGQKESTDINALCGDYLRLAYQGLKAKNKDFNATMETHFDSNIPKIEIIPQEIGRVLLNLITNAFYAVNERNKQFQRADSPSGVGGRGGQEQKPTYEPTVAVTTQPTAKSQLLIAISDNGSGIPNAIKDKIFQPFFTTKPTGQGTGLGLSLAYDIVKAHGGELKVETEAGEGSEFIIVLPINC